MGRRKLIEKKLEVVRNWKRKKHEAIEKEDWNKKTYRKSKKKKLVRESD